MKENIHPQSHKLTLIFQDGTEFTTNSSSNIGRIILDIDYRKHPAWTGNMSLQVNSKDKKVAGFNKRFEGLGSLFNSISETETSESKEEQKD